MQFDVKDPEVKRDSRTRRRAILCRTIGDLRYAERADIVIFVIATVLAFFSGVVGIIYLYDTKGWLGFLIGGVIGYVVSYAVIYGSLFVLNSQADKMMKKLCTKYNIERDRYMRKALEEIGYKTSEHVFPAEYREGNKVIILHQQSVDYSYYLEDNNTRIKITYEPEELSLDASNRNGLGIRAFDSKFVVEWDDEVKARAYLSSTMVLNLQSKAKEIDNFVDKKIEIQNTVAGFSKYCRGVETLSDYYFQKIKDIINESKAAVEDSKKFIDVSNQYSFLMKE